MVSQHLFINKSMVIQNIIFKLISRQEESKYGVFARQKLFIADPSPPFFVHKWSQDYRSSDIIICFDDIDVNCSTWYRQ